VRALDALLFSSVWVAAAAAALSAAVSLALGAVPTPGPVLVAFGGTLAIYGVDRLRDVARDRDSAPERSAFVSRHRAVLIALAAAGGAIGAAGAWLAGPRAWAPLAIALPLALFHRRLKRFWALKALYVTAAWIAVVVAVPAAVAPAAPQSALSAAAILGLAIFANAIASNVRDGEAAAAIFGGEAALRVARAAAALATVGAFLAPFGVRPLGWVGIATLGALLGFRPGERYGLAIIDGALLLGALTALAANSVAIIA
jgi:4-hydroxybenzoate polyprenyltransferase